MKKIFALILTLSCLFCCSFPTLAEIAVPADPLADNLIVHYDFEGSDLETQLKDKATGGSTNEDLKLYTATDGETIESYVRDGVLHMTPTAGEWANFAYGGDASSGTVTHVDTDLYDCAEAGEMTIYLDFNISGALQTSFSDFLDIGNICRLYCRSTDSGVNSVIGVRTTSKAYSSGAFGQASLDGSAHKIGSADYIKLAIVLKYDASAKSLQLKSYVSQDDGKTYTLTESSFSNDTAGTLNTFFEKAWRIRLTKDGANSNGIFDYNDIRIYDKALSLTEIISINAEGSTIIGAQNSAIAEGTDGKTVDIRFISGLKSLSYGEVGYTVEIDGQSTVVKGNTVYSQLKAKESLTGEIVSVTAEQYGYRYLYAYVITDIPVPAEGSTLVIKVTPFVKVDDSDGGTLNGEAMTFTVASDGSMTAAWN